MDACTLLAVVFLSLRYLRQGDFVLPRIEDLSGVFFFFSSRDSGTPPRVRRGSRPTGTISVVIITGESPKRRRSYNLPTVGVFLYYCTDVYAYAIISTCAPIIIDRKPKKKKKRVRTTVCGRVTGVGGESGTCRV